MSNLIVLHNSHNTEKVIYFLLLERKRRRPALEDDDEIAQKVPQRTGRSGSAA